MGVKCVLCGLESDRADWVNNPSPQCDFHKGQKTLSASELPAFPLTPDKQGDPIQDVNYPGSVPIDIDTGVIQGEVGKHAAQQPASPQSPATPLKGSNPTPNTGAPTAPPPPPKHEGPVKHFLHEMEEKIEEVGQKVEEKLHHKEKPPTKKSGSF